MTTLPTRRRFITVAPWFGVALLAACTPKSEPPAPQTSSEPISSPTPASMPEATQSTSSAAAANLPMVEQSDAQAVALGYVDNAMKADSTKFKSYKPGSQCSGCALYLGKAGDASGPCPLFVGKRVAATGWCGSWVKKA